MINTTEKTLSPIFFITFLFGFGILRCSLNKLRYLFSIFYILIVWSVYAYTVYYTINHSYLIKIVFNSLTSFFVIIVNLFMVIISIINAICKHEKYRQYMRKFDHVDDTLEELGISKEYRGMQNYVRWILIAWFLITCMSWSFDCLVAITTYNDIKAMLIPYVANYSIYVNTITDITFMILLRYIGNRLDKINDHISQLLEIEDYELRCKWNKSLIVSSRNVRGAQNRKRVLWIVIHLHSELCRTARDINGYFGIQMTLQMISYFIILINIFYFQFYILMHWKKIYKSDIELKIMISSSIWSMMYLIKLISFNHMCESVSTKAQKTKAIIHKLTNLISLAEVREEICQFVLQMSLRPLKFSGLGLFYFGYDFIREFFMWIITAVIFMAQMDVIPIWTHFRNNRTYYEK